MEQNKQGIISSITNVNIFVNLDDEYIYSALKKHAFLKTSVCISKYGKKVGFYEADCIRVFLAELSVVI